MGHAVTALAVAAFVASGAATAATSSTSVAASTANRRAVQVSGATAKGVSYTIAGGLVTSFTVQLKGRASLTATATARYGAGPSLPCVIGLYDAAGDRTPVTCTGFAEPAARPRDLRVTVA